MKIQQNTRTRAGIFVSICFLTVILYSCTKDRYGYGYNNLAYNNAPNNTPVALISVIDASPDAGNLDFYLDQNRANGYPLSFGNGLAYLQAYTGKRTAAFYKSGTNTLVKSDTITLKANNYYSLYLANYAAKPDYLFLTDTIAQPAAKMANVRFVDVSTDAPAVDLGIKGGALITTNKNYKGYSSFISIKADTTYTFEVRPKGTSNVLVSQSNVVIRSGSIYTIWLYGLAAATDNTRISLGIQRNAYY
jgi:hypothetical protein